MVIKALIFDFGGTLAKGSIDWRCYHEDIIKLLRGHGYDVDSDELRRAVSAAMGWLEDVRKGDVEPSFDELYSRILDDLGIPLDAKILGSIRSLYHKDFQVQIYPCVKDILEELSKKFKLALISNTISNIPHLFLMNSGLAEYFEEIVCSSEMGIRKPDPRIFQYVLRRFGVSPCEALHIGDGLETDVEGAARAGVRAVWIRDSRNSSRYEPSIDSVCELPSLIKKIGSMDESG